MIMKTRIRLLSLLFTVLFFSACNGAMQPISPTETPGGDEAADNVGATTPQLTFAPQPCDLALPEAEDWLALVCETFASEESVFPAESQDNEYANYSGAVMDGEYRLDYTAKNFAGFQRTALTWFDIATAQDFALSVTGLMTTDFREISWGIAFRGSPEKDNFFLFSVYNDGTYAFEIFENGGWIPLISRRPFSGILPDQPNTLTVIAEGQNFRFLVNGEAVNFFNGGLLEGMDIMLMVSVKEGASVVYTFDDLVVQI